MSVREIVDVGHPVLRVRARDVDVDEVHSTRVQQLVDDLIDTMRAANGAGLAANQIDETLRVAVAEVRPGNPRYPYKPALPLTVMINPRFEPIGDATLAVNEGCLSVPNLRGVVERHFSIRVHYLDRHGEHRAEVFKGLSAGTFQHEVDHLDGVLFLDRVRDTRSLMTWKQFDLHHRAAFEERMRAVNERVGAT
jgi:peptide deformylase